MFISIILRIAIVLAITAELGYAGQGTWTSGGPYGGDVMALAINPSAPGTIYAGTDGGGIFKSTDSGATWIAANSGLTNPFVRALAIDPTTPATLYAATVSGGGVFKSTNAGANWTPVNSGLTTLSVNALAINPANTATLYAGTDNGLFRSLDGGANWNAVNSGLTNTFVYALAIDPVSPARLYAGTNGGGVFKSLDGGGTWFAANTGLSDGFVYTLAINPAAAPGTVYAGTDSGPFKSTDSGGMWAAATSGLSGLVISVLVINPATPATLYAATNTGIFKSIDAAGTWSAANTGLAGQTVLALAINPTTTTTVYAGASSGGGVFKSTDAGGSWIAANTGVSGLIVRAVAVNPAAPATLYAAASGTVGLFKSANGGSSWTAANTGLTSTFVVALAINPATPATLYAGTSGLGVFKSTDAGATWSDASTGLSLFVNTLAIDPMTPATLYAGSNGDGVYKSIDGGATWVAVNSGLSSLVVYALAIDPATPGTLYAGTEAGVFKSVNSGATWVAANSGLSGSSLFVYALAINPTTPTTLYAGTDAGVFKSTTSGGSWTAANTGLTNTFVAALAINPATPATVYAGTLGGGVFTSTDAGVTWSASNTGQTNPRPRVNALALNPTGATLYAGLESGSVWQLTFGVVTAPQVTTQPANQTVSPGTTASFSAAASGSPSPTVQWQVSTNSGAAWTDISGATSTAYSFTAVLADSGKQYRAVFTNSAGTATTNAATLTVSTGPSAPAVTLQPANQTVNSGATASFSAAASGSPSPTVQWQVSTNSGGTWSDISGATSTAHSFTAAAGDSGKQYRAIFTNSAGSATTNAATLTVNSPPAITTHPANQTVAAGATATFSAAAGGSPSPTVQWQVSANGGTSFSDVAGATAATYSFPVATADNGKRVRAVFTNSAGTATSNAATLTVSNPTMALDKTSLVFAAVTTGAAFTSQTAGQAVRLTQVGVGTVQWTVTSTVPWLVVSPSSGAGSGTFTISTQFASGLAASQTAAVNLVLTGAGNTVGPINVTLTTTPNTAPASLPFGAIDTPIGDATVLAGSVAITGWTLDNIGVKRVELWRDLQPGETTPPFASTPTDPRHGKVFISNATFVAGARPDVEALNGTTPFAYRAGWGYLMLTWGLWNQGNGTYTFHAFGFDEEGNVASIGSKTAVVSNNTATKPFGSIDTPAIGGDASGPNFGWALTPTVNGAATCKIQPSGVQVSIDSGPLQPVVYGTARTDIAGAFPGFSNTAGAGGHFLFDWSTLAPGAHTIGWLVTDDCNRADGVGSRFFNVASGSSLTSSDAEFRLKAEATQRDSVGSAFRRNPAEGVVTADLVESSDPITVAHGYGELPQIVTPGAAGSRVVEVRQGDRIEIRLPRDYESAHQLGTDGQHVALPTGSTWDAASGTFYWQPAPAFLGRYRIVFSDGTKRISVRVIVTP